ncbi:MAG TPA: DUF2034 domain-containing protein [Herpetosiphonaceae bacterium]
MPDWNILLDQGISFEYLQGIIIGVFLIPIVMYLMHWREQKPYIREWERIQSQWQHSEWERNDRGRIMFRSVLDLSPTEFEIRIQYLLKDLGWKNVERVGGRGDHGVDVQGFYGGEYCIVQCKRYRANVAPNIIRELEGARSHARADRAFLVTTGQFTKQGHEFARGKPIELWDGEMLAVKFQEQFKLLEDAESYNHKRRLYEQQYKLYNEQRRRSQRFYGGFAVVGIAVWIVPWLITSPIAPSQGATEQAPLATESPTPQPQQATIAPTPTVTDICGQATIRGVDRLTIRSAPSLNADRISDYPSGTQVVVLCETPVQADSVLWQKVRIENTEGWMSKRFLKE